jgi:hypothetical protein
MSNDNTTPSKLSRIIAFDPRGIHPKVRVPVLKSVVTLLHRMHPAPNVNAVTPMNASLEKLLHGCTTNPECRFFFFVHPTKGFSVTTQTGAKAVSDSDDIEYVERYTSRGTFPYVVERYTDPIKWFKAGLQLSQK